LAGTLGSPQTEPARVTRSGPADELTLERIRESVQEMRAQKAALHPDKEQ
jgi:hypothetical protein